MSAAGLTAHRPPAIHTDHATELASGARPPGAPGASFDPRWNEPAPLPGPCLSGRALLPGDPWYCHCSPRAVLQRLRVAGGGGKSRSSPFPGTVGCRAWVPRPCMIADRPVAFLVPRGEGSHPGGPGHGLVQGQPEPLLGPRRMHLVWLGFGPLGGNTISQLLVSVKGGPEGARPRCLHEGPRRARPAARWGSSLGMAVHVALGMQDRRPVLVLG